MHRFVTVFAVSGLLYSVYVFLLNPGDVLLTIVPISLVAGMVFGAALGLVAHRVGERLKKSLVSAIALSLLAGITGLIAGILIILLVRGLPHGRWRALENAPEKPVRFIGNSAFDYFGGSIYVESESGGTWSHTCPLEGPCGWKRETAIPLPPEENDWSCSPVRKAGGRPPPLLRRVVDSHEVNICEADYEVKIRFVLLDSGSVLVWSHFDSALELLGIFILSTIACPVIGIVGTVVLLIRRRRFDRY